MGTFTLSTSVTCRLVNLVVSSLYKVFTSSYHDFSALYLDQSGSHSTCETSTYTTNMALMLSLHSRARLALLAFRGTPLYIHSRGRLRTSEMRPLLSVGQRYSKYITPCRKNSPDLNRRWKSYSRDSTQPHNPSLAHTQEESQVIHALMGELMSSRNDWRDPDDLNDFEFNMIYIEVISMYPELDLTLRDPDESIDEPMNQPHFAQPRIYQPRPSTWEPSRSKNETLKRGHTLKVASWNLFSPSANIGARASAALTYLRTMFGQKPHDLVIMLGGVLKESLRAILDDKWVQENFVLSDVKPPDWLCELSRDPEERYWKSNADLSLMLISRDLPIAKTFRVPYVPNMRSNVLIVDIPVSSENQGLDQPKRLLRLGTTDLDLGGLGRRLEELYSQQQAVISTLLAGVKSKDIIHGGLVDGGMDSPHRTKYRGFFYQGSIEMRAPVKAQEFTGKIGRFGIGLKTNVGGQDLSVSDHFGITVEVKII
ncbi:hypothetical protein F4810DRAFT_659196 [Camillea tinctor]|nr:hypothetical protein F4810DRAFT_659196 [Camillea tinctor]